MKDIYKDDELPIPEGVLVSVKSRIVRVKGPRGELTKNLRHVDLEIQIVKSRKLRFIVWHATRKHAATIRTVRSIINNMMNGVMRGFEYKMRYAYAHFPIGVNIVEHDDGPEVEIRNFLGERIVRRVKMLPGVGIKISTTQKDELILFGNDLENVSQSAASIQQSTAVKNKDIRKFLDGIYVSERGFLVKETA